MRAAVGLAFARVGDDTVRHFAYPYRISLPSSWHASMTSVLTLAGDFLLQVSATSRDTIITKQIAARGLFEQLTAAASTVMTFALLALVVVAIPVAWRLRATYQKFDKLLERIHNDVAPIISNAHSVTDNLNFITTAIRTDVAKLHETIDAGNERVRRAIDQSEQRVKEFNALLRVVQEEAEGLFISTASTVRGVQEGTRAFQDPSGMDLASDELDADVESDREFDLEEESDGNQRRTESPSDAGPAAPRVRPRAPGRRHA